MSKIYQKVSRKRANDGKISIKKPDRKVTRIEYVKSLVNPENQKVSDFVLRNKETIFNRIEKKVVDDIQVLGIEGFTCLIFSIVLNLLFIYSLYSICFLF